MMREGWNLWASRNYGTCPALSSPPDCRRSTAQRSLISRRPDARSITCTGLAGAEPGVLDCPFVSA
jgi:hypothetical protein